MRLLLAAMLVAALAATPAAAGTWTEVGDAGGLPGAHQVPTGTDPFTAISGTLTNVVTTNADMYCIRIPDPTAFVATTTGGTTLDTQLWLFYTNGNGITFNDDNPQGGLQSRITGMFVPGPGEYLLAVSAGYTCDAVNASNLEIWLDSPFNVERAPDGPGAPGPVTGWIGTATAGSYTIALTGVLFCQSTAVESASWGVIKAMYR